MAASLPGARVPESKATLKILVVDPKPQSRSILKGSLRSLEMVHSVIERGSTVDLQQVLEEDQVNLVIVDQDLGDHGDPVEIIRSLQESPSPQKARYVLVGLRLDDETRRKASGLGVTGFLTKPFDLQSLERALWDGLGLKPPADGGAAKEPGPQVPKDVLERLKRVPVFARFTDVELLRLLKICQFRRIPAGQYVFREGEQGDRLYVLVSGQVDIKRVRGEESRTLDTMLPGNCFGEMAIIDSSPRSADAFAFSDVMVIEIMEETVNNDDDMIALKLVRQLAVMLTRKLREKVGNN
jgi:CheY-like chemotaxis protein